MISKCGSCASMSFRLQEVSPKGANFKFHFIQCAMCGVPVGVVDYMHVPTGIANLEKDLKNVQTSTSNIESRIANIEHYLRLMANK